MKLTISRVCLATVFALISLFAQPAILLAADADPATKATFDRLVAAIQAKDRDAFVKDATDEMRQAITLQLMDSINRDIGTRLAKGFEPTYLCQLKQRGHQVYLWKVAFKDGGDDVIIRIVMRDDKLAGFFRQ